MNELDRLLATLMPQRMANGGEPLNWYQQALLDPVLKPLDVEGIDPLGVELGDGTGSGQVSSPSRSGPASLSDIGQGARAGQIGGAIAGILGGPAVGIGVRGLGTLADVLTANAVLDAMSPGKGFTNPEQLGVGDFFSGMLNGSTLGLLGTSIAERANMNAFPELTEEMGHAIGGMPRGQLGAGYIDPPSLSDIMGAIGAASTLGGYGQESGGPPSGGPSTAGIDAAIGGMEGSPFADGGQPDPARLQAYRSDGVDPSVDLDRFLADLDRVKQNNNGGIGQFLDKWTNGFAQLYGLSRDYGIPNAQIKRGLLAKILPMLGKSETEGMSGWDGVDRRLKGTTYEPNEPWYVPMAITRDKEILPDAMTGGVPQRFGGRRMAEGGPIDNPLDEMSVDDIIALLTTLEAMYGVPEDQAPRWTGREHATMDRNDMPPPDMRPGTLRGRTDMGEMFDTPPQAVGPELGRIAPRGDMRMASGGALGAFGPGGHVPPGSYVIPADVTAALGEGSNDAGLRRLGAFGALGVSGPGTGRSDSIPAVSAGRPLRLSNGEAVIPPDGVRRAGGPERLDNLVVKARKRYRRRMGAFGAPRGAGSYAEGGVVGAYNPATGFRTNTVDEPRGVLDALLSYFGGNLRSWAEPAAPGPEADSLSRRNELFGITDVPTKLEVAMMSGFGSPGIMAGPKAKTADLLRLALAQDMASKGASADDILKGTGWFQGADKKWRFEIPDNENVVLNRGQYGPEDLRPYIGIDTSMPTRDLLEHPALYAAYDANEIAPVTRTFPRFDPMAPQGAFDDATRTIHLGSGRNADAKSTMLHELQHAIQKYEGFAPGGDPAQLKFDDPREAYRRLAGEVEARNVQSRMDMTPEQRLAKPPWATEDVRRDLQIILDNAGVKGPQMSLPMDTASRMARAKEMGHTVDVYHGTQNRVDWLSDPRNKEAIAAGLEGTEMPGLKPGSTVAIPEFKPRLGGLKLMDGLGIHAGTPEAAVQRLEKYHGKKFSGRDLAPQLAESYVMPLLGRAEKPFTKADGTPYSEAQLQSRLADIAEKLGHNRANLRNYSARHAPPPGFRQAQRDIKSYLKAQGYDSIPYINSHEARGSTSWIFLEPNQLRSRFAAFDPAKRGSPDLMAGLLPLGLLSATQDEAGR